MSNITNNKIEIETLAKKIVGMYTDQKCYLECTLMMPKLLRQLYKALGTPKPSDYEGVGNHICQADRISGYTKCPYILTKSTLEHLGGQVNYRIARPSEIKQRIVESYTSDGWDCEVQAYNVLCDKYVPHKDYDNIWIHFISTRDCSKYEYVLVREDQDEERDF